MSGSGTGTPVAGGSQVLSVANSGGAGWRLERASQPDIEPVTLAEMKRHLREFDSLPATADADISALIVAARQWVEDYTGRALIDQVWRLTMAGGGNPLNPYWPPVIARTPLALLRRSPVIAVTSVATADTNGDETELTPEDYALTEPDSKFPSLSPVGGASWTGNALRIEFRAGYADRLGSPQEGAEVVPDTFKMAIKLYAEAHYDRDAVMMEKLVAAAENLLKGERCQLGLA